MPSGFARVELKKNKRNTRPDFVFAPRRRRRIYTVIRVGRDRVPRNVCGARRVVGLWPTLSVDRIEQIGFLIMTTYVHTHTRSLSHAHTVVYTYI